MIVEFGRSERSKRGLDLAEEAGRMLPICVEGRRYLESEIEEQHKPR
jgi:hypothetical protein